MVKGNWKHGGSHTPTHNSWIAMIRRCDVPEQAHYERYGGRGITVCSAWRDFRNFVNDMHQRPENTTLDRIDNDGNYSCGKCEQCAQHALPMNCRWASLIEQKSNTSLTVLYDLDGRQETLPNLCREFGINKESVRKRLGLGWSLRDALTRPINIHEKVSVRKYEHEGERLSLPQWSKRSGISPSVLANRMHDGMTMTEALSKPYRKIGKRIK